jgi:membrane fusion protein (multidrug efflux system)
MYECKSFKHRSSTGENMTFAPRILALAITMIVLVLAGCKEENQASKGSSPQAAAQATEVGVVTVQTQTVPLSVELPGRVRAYQTAEIRPRVSGIILERMFEEGGTVKVGQQLYQIDPAPYQASYEAAVAQLEKARATLTSVKARAARYEDLVKVDAVSQQEYDDAVAGLEQAQADVAIAEAAAATAKISLDYTKVFSPIAGTVGKSSVTVGALVTADQAAPLAVVRQLDPVYVDVSQSSADLLELRERISSGQIEGTTPSETPVELLPNEAGDKYGHEGQLKFSEVSVDETTGSVQIRAVFPNPNGMLLPGLFVRAVVTQGMQSNVLLVPQQAVARDAAGGASVWVVDSNNTAQPRPVTTGPATGDKWIVTEGLLSGDRVIVEGLQKIGPGAPVRPVALDAEPAGAAAGGTASEAANTTPAAGALQPAPGPEPVPVPVPAPQPEPAPEFGPELGPETVIESEPPLQLQPTE